VVNKVDRHGARADWVVNQTFDLFDKLGAAEEQLDFPVIYARRSKAGRAPSRTARHRPGAALRRRSSEHVPVRDEDPDGPLQLQICSLDYSSYVGKIGIGRISAASCARAGSAGRQRARTRRRSRPRSTR
jgi:GTP-binding protein